MAAALSTAGVLEAAGTALTTEHTKPRPLTAFDRCGREFTTDRGRGQTNICGAKAYVRAIMPEGDEILLCGHHGAESTASLRALGAIIFAEPVVCGCSNSNCQ